MPQGSHEPPDEKWNSLSPKHPMQVCSAYQIMINKHIHNAFPEG
jgi:hypothetical protein